MIESYQTVAFDFLDNYVQGGDKLNYKQKIFIIHL